MAVYVRQNRVRNNNPANRKFREEGGDEDVLQQKVKCAEAEVLPQPTEKTTVEQMPTLQPVEVDMEVDISWRHDSPWRNHTVAGFSWQELWPLGNNAWSGLSWRTCSLWRRPLLEQFLKDHSPCYNRERVLRGWNSKELSWTHHKPPFPIPYTACGRGDRGVRNGGVGNEGVKLSLGNTGFGKDVLRCFCYVSHHPNIN